MIRANGGSSSHCLSAACWKTGIGIGIEFGTRCPEIKLAYRIHEVNLRFLQIIVGLSLFLVLRLESGRDDCVSNLSIDYNSHVAISRSTNHMV